MKPETSRRLFTFGGIAISLVGAVVVVDAFMGGSLIHWSFEPGMVLPVAIYVTLTLACVWAVTGRSNESLREFGLFGKGLPQDHPEMKIGGFVRVLCGFVTMISLVPIVLLAAAEFLKPVPWTPIPPIMIAILFMCLCVAAFFAYIAIFGRIPQAFFSGLRRLSGTQPH